jgi:phosphonate transport system substrate-binding protein
MTEQRGSSTGEMASPVRRRSQLGAVILVIVIVALGTAAVYFINIRSSSATYVEGVQQQLLKSVDFSEQQRASQLAEGYTDANGDLVADPPKDAAAMADPPELAFTYVAVEDPAPFQEAMNDLVTHLAKVTGKKVTYTPFVAPEDELRALHDGKLQVAAFATGQVPAAVNRAGFVPVASFGSDAGKGTYLIEILVKPDSPIQSPADLRGHELTLTEINSNSGYKAPLVILKRSFSLLPFKDYQLRYSGGHEQSVAGLAKGDYSAIVVASDVLARCVHDGVITPAQFRSIYKSDAFPSAVFGYAYNLKPELAAKVRSALLEFPFAGSTLDKRFGSPEHTKFVPVDYKADFTSVREIDDAVGQTIPIASPPSSAPATTTAPVAAVS